MEHTNNENRNEFIISKLKFFNDDPADKSETFGFNKYSKELTSLLIDSSLSTPFCIGLDGEWGSGKTSLIKQVYANLQDNNDIKSKKIKLVWFDAWAYERLDPISSLMFTIASEYGEKGKEFKKIVNKLIPVSNIIPTVIGSAVGIPIPPINIANILQDFQSRKSDNQPIFTITKKMTEMMCEDIRLIIFVDDLDKCSVDNVLDIFEAVKIFLNAPKVVVIVAADMKKLEDIWMQRYGSIHSASKEGREHIEKIFQLKISLPPKQEVDIQDYIQNKLRIDISDYNELLTEGCPANPRKIKRILNLIYFISKGIKQEDFSTVFPLVILWSTITVTYPEVAAIVKLDTISLFRISLLIHYFNSYNFLLIARKPIEDMNLDNMYGNISPTSLRISNEINIPFKLLDGLVVKGLKLVLDDPNLFKLLKLIAKYCKMPTYNHTTVESELTQNYSDLAQLLGKVIYTAGLIA